MYKDEDDDVEYFDIFDKKTLNKETFVNFEGQVIEAKKPWYDAKVFTLLGKPIKIRSVVIGTGAIIGIFIACITLCCVISWWKKK